MVFHEKYRYSTNTVEIKIKKYFLEYVFGEEFTEINFPYFLMTNNSNPVIRQVPDFLAEKIYEES